MKNILTIFKKEIDRVFKDRRLITTLFILPGLFIFIIYSFIGSAISNAESGDMFNVAIVNITPEFESIYQTSEKAIIEAEFINDEETYTTADINEAYEEKFNIVEISNTDIDDYKMMVDEDDWNLVISFPDNINDFQVRNDHPVVLFYTNPVDSASAITRFQNYVYAYDEVLKANLYGDTSYISFDFQQSEISDNQLIGTIMSSLLPMLVIMFLFSGAMSIGPESIAGEKERNTISTLLITPIKRSELAIGKILSLSVLSLISAFSSFIGIIFSLPRLLNIGSYSLSVFTISQYLLMLVVLFSTIFVIIGIVATVSAYAKTLKEASTYISPIYILTVIVSVSTMFSTGSATNPLVYVIPIYNAVQSLVGIMTFTDGIGLYVLITALSNTTYLFIFIYILNKMFQSERIMFNK